MASNLETSDSVPQIVDSQVHLWTTGTPGGTHQKHPYTMEDALQGMDAAGVSGSVVVPPPWDPDGNGVAIEAARRYPDRFAVMGEFPLDEPASRSKVENWTNEPGMFGIRVAFSQPAQRAFLTNGTADWLWPAAESAELPIMVFAPGLLQEVSQVARRHPGLKICIDHMGLVTGTTNREAFEPVLPYLIDLAKAPNAAIKLSSAPIYSGADYPYRDICGYLEQLFEAFGPTRCFWGSDITRMPCSWRQCVTHFTEELPWLRGHDREMVMGVGVCDWIGWRRGSTATVVP